jgi:hypothetical protein
VTTPAVGISSYRRALVAEPRLVAISRMVDVLCSFVRPDDVLCAGCAWELIIKPLILPLVGWERGLLLESAEDPSPKSTSGWISGSSLIDAADLQESSRTPASTRTEHWLRTSDAYDAVVGELVHRLDTADPGNGHGLVSSR